MCRGCVGDGMGTNVEAHICFYHYRKNIWRPFVVAAEREVEDVFEELYENDCARIAELRK